jgi:hypothetical protein
MQMVPRSAHDEPLGPEAWALAAFAQFFDRIAKRQDRDDVQSVRNPQQRLDLRQVIEADPVGTDPFGPGGQNHRLDGAAGVGDSIGRFFHGDHDRQWRLDNIWPATRQCGQFLQSVMLLHHDEMPGLSVDAAAGQPGRFDDPADHFRGDGLGLEHAYSQDSPNCFKNIHSRLLLT